MIRCLSHVWNFQYKQTGKVSRTVYNLILYTRNNASRALYILETKQFLNEYT